MCFSCFKGFLFWHPVCFSFFPFKSTSPEFEYIPLQSHKLSVCDTWSSLFKKICWKSIKTLCTITRRPASPSGCGSQASVTVKNELIPPREISQVLLCGSVPTALICVSEPHRSVLSAGLEALHALHCLRSAMK